MKKKFLRVVSGVLMFFACLTLGESSSSAHEKTGGNLRDLSDLTAKIVSLNEQLQKSKPENKSSRFEIRELSKSRFALLSALAETNPSAVLRFALAEEILAKMPADLRKNFEKREDLEGELEAIAECDDDEARILYYLNSGQERFSVRLTREPAGEMLTGMRVKIKGVRVGQTIVSEAIEVNEKTSKLETDSFQAAASVLPNTFGEQKLLVLLVNFQDDQRQPFSVDQLNNLVFNTADSSSVTNYYREASYQQTWLTGSVQGYFTLPINSGDCDGGQISLYAKRAATAAGINLSDYNKYMYFFPTMPACSYGGRGTIGGNETWINGYLHLGTISHELGHNFGLYHARALECGAQVTGNNCSTVEYGSNIDAMGKPGVTGHFHPFQKERLGWLNYGASPAVNTVRTSGNYLIAPYSTFDFGTKALKILKSTDSNGVNTWYHIEFRRPVGYDKIISSNSNLMNGVVISQNRDSNGQENYLLDMTPETTSWDDPALVLNRSYTDSNAGFTITPLSIDGNGIVVNITFGTIVTPTPQSTPSPMPSPTLTPTPIPTPSPTITPSPTPTPAPPCYLASPSITVSPSATQWIAAGSSVPFTVTVTNKNSGNCPNTNFSLQTNAPNGWNSVFASQVLVIPSGGSATTTFQIAVPGGTANGNYAVLVRATSTASPAYTASASVNCSVYSSLDLSVYPNQPSYTRTQNAVVTAVISANGSPMSGAGVTFTMTKSNGVIVKIYTTTAADGSAVFSYRFNKKNDPLGVYSINVDASLNGATGKGSTSFTVK